MQTEEEVQEVPIKLVLLVLLERRVVEVEVQKQQVLGTVQGDK
jgi:hypothetical protein